MVCHGVEGSWCVPDQAREGLLKQLPHLLEARANGLGGLELGCLIGLGSYGKVYKGAALSKHSDLLL